MSGRRMPPLDFTSYENFDWDSNNRQEWAASTVLNGFKDTIQSETSGDVRDGQSWKCESLHVQSFGSVVLSFRHSCDLKRACVSWASLLVEMFIGTEISWGSACLATSSVVKAAFGSKHRQYRGEEAEMTKKWWLIIYRKSSLIGDRARVTVVTRPRSDHQHSAGKFVKI
jgi:hypothetical protein